jgi:hypothetical protein
MAFTRAAISYRDFSREIGSVSVRGEEITAVNFDAQEAEIHNLQLAITSVTLGVAQSEGFTQKTRLSNQSPSNGAANRETKWLVTYEDDVTFQLGTYELPCADVENEGLRHLNTDIADLTHALWIQFISDFEAYARSPQGNTVRVVKIILVGRNV